MVVLLGRASNIFAVPIIISSAQDCNILYTCSYKDINEDPLILVKLCKTTAIFLPIIDKVILRCSFFDTKQLLHKLVVTN